MIVLVAAVATIPLLPAVRRRMTSRDLEIWRMLQRFQITRSQVEADAVGLARAVGRCAMCPSVEECGRWLTSGKADGVDEFCPNASFVAQAGAAKDLRQKR